MRRSRPLAARRPCQRPSPAPGQAHHRLQVQRALVVGRTRQSRSRATARATSNDDTCACTRAQRCTRKRDAAAEPRPAARTPAARQRRLCCSIAFARSVPAPRCVAGAQRYLHACERATYPRDVRDEKRILVVLFLFIERRVREANLAPCRGSISAMLIQLGGSQMILCLDIPLAITCFLAQHVQCRRVSY
jgi:hypothetical protein